MRIHTQTYYTDLIQVHKVWWFITLYVLLTHSVAAHKLGQQEQEVFGITHIIYI